MRRAVARRFVRGKTQGRVSKAERRMRARMLRLFMDYVRKSEPPRFWFPPSLIARTKIYPMCELSKLANVPDDVRPSWRRAAIEAAAVVLAAKTTDQNYANAIAALRRLRGET